jgi:hypothetical protein
MKLGYSSKSLKLKYGRTRPPCLSIVRENNVNKIFVYQMFRNQISSASSSKVQEQVQSLPANPVLEANAGGVECSAQNTLAKITSVWS